MDAAMLALLILLIAVVGTALIIIIRYAIDSSRTSRKIDNLINEVQMLRKEVRRTEHKHSHIDEKI